MENKEKVTTDIKASAEILELRRGEYSDGGFAETGCASSLSGWSHVATVRVRLGTAQYILKIECFDVGRLFRCLECSDPKIMQHLNGSGAEDCTMRELFRDIISEQLHDAIMRMEEDYYLAGDDTAVAEAVIHTKKRRLAYDADERRKRRKSSEGRTLAGLDLN
jgi:hypothetical protein